MKIPLKSRLSEWSYIFLFIVGLYIVGVLIYYLGILPNPTWLKLLIATPVCYYYIWTFILKKPMIIGAFYTSKPFNGFVDKSLRVFWFLFSLFCLAILPYALEKLYR